MALCWAIRHSSVSLECMLLCHSSLGTIQTIADELTEKWITDFAFDVVSELTLMVNQIHLIPFRLACNVDVLARTDVTVCTENNGTSIAPSAEAVRCEPVYAEVAGCSVITDQEASPKSSSSGNCG